MEQFNWQIYSAHQRSSIIFFFLQIKCKELNKDFHQWWAVVWTVSSKLNIPAEWKDGWMFVVSFIFLSQQRFHIDRNFLIAYLCIGTNPKEIKSLLFLRNVICYLLFFLIHIKTNTNFTKKKARADLSQLLNSRNSWQRLNIDIRIARIRCGHLGPN